MQERHYKAQSAMEYLMTYGWSILIIAIALVVLFELGIFNTSNLGPHAQPGSCQVYKSQNTGLGSVVSLGGICNNVPPQSVAVFSGSSTIAVNVLGAKEITSSSGAITITVWAKTNNQNGGILQYNLANTYLSLFYDSQSCGFYRPFFNAPGPNGGCYVTLPSVQQNQWYFYALTYNGFNANGLLYLAIDGEVYSEPSSGTYSYNLNGNVISSNPQMIIGEFYNFGTGTDWNGLISNIQIYNTSLSSNEITDLYMEGIGGDPILPQNLIGWWPLNGNSNDYSGNGNNGQPIGIVYTSSWNTGYSTP